LLLYPFSTAIALTVSEDEIVIGLVKWFEPELGRDPSVV
jgi:hypothetical protein